MKMNKGISLIVLVVTIIVMIIIAGAIILSLSNTNVIDQAEQAKDKYNLSQIKEAIKLEKTNALLARYDTAENVNISVKELLGLTDANAMNVTSTNTIPANMPAGKYYKLDVTKYGIQDIGTIENDTIKGIYVINDNYDIYYVIEGTIEAPKEIDDTKVSQCIMGLLTGGKELEIVQQLKLELYIQDESLTRFSDIAFDFFDSETNLRCCYFYTIDRLYFLNTETMQGGYADKNEKTTLYELASKLEQIRQELRPVIVGKTIPEIQAKRADGTLKQEILDNCNSIKDVRFGNRGDDNFIMTMVFEYGNKEVEDFLGYNTIRFIIDDNGVYTNVTIEKGA